MSVNIRKHNYYKRVLAVQDTYLLYKDSTTTARGVFFKHIEPIYNISERTFWRYLNIKAKGEIKRIEEEKQKLKSCQEQ